MDGLFTKTLVGDSPLKTWENTHGKSDDTQYTGYWCERGQHYELWVTYEQEGYVATLQLTRYRDMAFRFLWVGVPNADLLECCISQAIAAIAACAIGIQEYVHATD